MLCLPLYSTSTKGLSDKPIMLIGFSNPFILLCFAALDRFSLITPFSSSLSISALFFMLPWFVFFNISSTRKVSGLGLLIEYSVIILQLKSTQNRNALANFSSIINYLYEKYGYRIKGHEIQQLGSNIMKMTLSERTSIISSFCAKNEIEYLTYHAPIIIHNIFDERWRPRI